MHDILDMRKFSAKLVPGQKRDKAILDRVRLGPFGFLNHLVTMAETWIIYVYDPETKEQSKEWKLSGSRVQRSSRHRSHQARC
jgi:hypothetical protein